MIMLFIAFVVGGFFGIVAGAVVMALLSGQAYEKGYQDGKRF